MDPVNLIGNQAYWKRTWMHRKKQGITEIWSLPWERKIKWGSYILGKRWDFCRREIGLDKPSFREHKIQTNSWDQNQCNHHIRLKLKLLLENKEPRKLEHLSKISLRNHLINLSHGCSIIQTIQNSEGWPKHYLNKLFDIWCNKQFYSQYYIWCNIYT